MLKHDFIGENNFVGRVFGKLKVLGIDRSRKDKKGFARPFWTCRCDCGREIYATTSSLLEERVTRCWHCRRYRMTEGESTFNQLCRVYRYAARDRNISWGLTKDEVRSLFAGRCHYCHCEPSLTKRYEGCRGSFTYNGI